MTVDLNRMDSLDCRWEMALDGLTPDERSTVCRRLSRQRYAARSRVYSAGDPPESLLIVETGRMRWFHLSETGEEFSMGIWPSGYTVGLISVLLDQPRPVCVESVEPTVMLSLKRVDVLELMRILPTFAINIARLAASIAAYSMYTTGPLALDHAAVRLCKVLESLAVRDGPQQELIIKGLNQEDLASLIGVSRTWVTIMLSNLERRGLIWRGRQQIGLLNIDAIRKFCREAQLQ